MSFMDIANGGINVVLLLAILVPLVVIHEFGHFLVARRAGVTVHEFGIGFPPRALTFHKDKKGTIYTLNWLPIGGFVRLEGEEGESADSHAFVNQRLREKWSNQHDPAAHNHTGQQLEKYFFMRSKIFPDVAHVCFSS